MTENKNRASEILNLPQTLYTFLYYAVAERVIPVHRANKWFRDTAKKASQPKK